MAIQHVKLSKQAKKQLRKVPRHILVNIMSWVEEVESSGLEEARMIPGYHDEPLKGKRSGQRQLD